MNNIYIYIRTPQIKLSNTYAHITEHCILNKNKISIKDFFAYCDIKGECYQGYTKFDINIKVDKENFIKNICKTLDQKIFKKELSTFKEETKKKIFTDILKETADRLIYHNIKSLKKGKISRNDIEKYHKKYYKRENMIICNTRHKILENNIKTKTARKRLLKIKKQAKLKLLGEKNKITIIPYTHRKSQILLSFIEFLYDTYIEYTQRYIKGKYNFPVSSMIETKEYVCIAIPQNTKINITESFLDEAKEYFCNFSMNEYSKKNTIINLLYIGQLTTNKEIKKFIKSIDLEIVKKILE